MLVDLMGIDRRECPHLSKDPGVSVGVSPTLRLLERLDFFSKFRFAREYSFEL